MSSIEHLEYQVDSEEQGLRLDQVAAQAFSGYSRARLQNWINSGALTVDGQLRKPKDKVSGGELLSLNVEIEAEGEWQAEEIPLDIVHQDDHIVVINKPAGLVVHPGAGVPSGTLLNALLYHYPEVQNIPRAGIVHRLDKDTSGIMVVARSLIAHHSLVQQLQDRSMGREYEAVVMGELTGGGKVDQAIGRHPSHRTKMAVLAHSQQAKPAVTHYRLLKRYRGYTHIRCSLETGRTHQIRVHMAHIKHPLVGDPVYLNRQRWVAGTSEALKEALLGFKRQALHARKLTLWHPVSEEEISWEIELPEDFMALLKALEQEGK